MRVRHWGSDRRVVDVGVEARAEPEGDCTLLGGVGGGDRDGRNSTPAGRDGGPDRHDRRESVVGRTKWGWHNGCGSGFFVQLRRFENIFLKKG